MVILRKLINRSPAYLLLVLSLCVLAYAILNTGLKEFFYTSDDLYLPALFKDLFVEQNSLSGWSLTPAPYFFPDMFIYFPILAVFREVELSSAVMAICQVLATYFLLMKLMSYFFSKASSWIAFLLGLFVLWIVADQLHNVLNIDQVPYVLMIKSTIHYSVVLCSLVFLLLSITCLCAKQVMQRYLCLLLYSFLLIFLVISDALAVAIYLVPHSIVCGLAYRQYKNKIYLYLIGINLFSILPSLLVKKIMLSYNVVIPNGLYFTFKYERYLEILKLFISECNQIILQFPIMGIILLVGALSQIYLLFVIIRGKSHFTWINQLNEIQKYLLMFFALASWINFVAVLVKQEWVSRYLVGFYFFPLFFMLGCIIYLIQKSEKVKKTIVVVGVILLGNFLFKISQLKKIPELYYPPEIACLDKVASEINLTRGIAGYWDAKRVSMISKKEVKVLQVDARTIKPYHWINNIHWYENVFDFVIVREEGDEGYNIREMVSYKKVGIPDRIISCGIYEILTYPKGFRLGSGSIDEIKYSANSN